MALTKPTYAMEQLSVRPSEIRVDSDLVLPNTFGSGLQEAMAALLITLARENGDQWQGFSVQSIAARVSEEAGKIRRNEGGGMLFGTFPNKIFQDGLSGLRERGAIRVERHGEDDVVYPTEELLKSVQRYIAV